MVLAKIGLEVIKRAVTYGSRLAKYDEFAWNKLYTGVPKHVRQGTRHGFIAGSTIGGLLSGATDLSDDGNIRTDAIPKRQRPKSNKQYKTYNRYRGGTYRNAGKFKHTCKCRPKRRYNNFRSR